MTKTRRIYAESFKAKVAIEAIKGVKTLSELSSQFGVHPVVIAHWKKHLSTHAAELFGRGKETLNARHDEKTTELYAEIGRLKVENDWLKKKL